MKTVLFAGYPKSGNTLLGHAFLFAGNEVSSGLDYVLSHSNPAEYFDYYHLLSSNKKPPLNPLFDSPTVCIKTHDLKRYSINLESSYYGGVSHVITIVRNPFETLLSGINFFRVSLKSNSFGQAEAIALNQLLPEININSETLFDDLQLENLKNSGLLNNALIRFAQYGTVFFNFYQMSGPWCTFANSYRDCGLPLLNVKFEDLSDDHQKSSQSIANFLNIDSNYLLSGFDKQKKYALEKKKNKETFYSKVKTGYWKNYFDKNTCKYFIDIYHREMKDIGYENVIEEVFDLL